MSESAHERLVVIEQVTRIAASPETVWSFWTDPQRLCEWWGIESELVPEPGGVFRVVMASGPIMLGEYIELDRPRRLIFTFGWEGNAPGEPLAPGSTRVEVTLVAEGGDTMLTLRHSEMPASHVADHRGGWKDAIDNRLAAAVTRSV